MAVPLNEPVNPAVEVIENTKGLDANLKTLQADARDVSDAMAEASRILNAYPQALKQAQQEFITSAKAAEDLQNYSHHLRNQ